MLNVYIRRSKNVGKKKYSTLLNTKLYKYVTIELR